MDEMDKREESSLQELIAMEDLAQKKTEIYARLLIDVDLAQKMEGLAERHGKRKERLEKLLYGEASGK